ncbi:MAG: N-acetylmuramoyl-L-alanine amidase [Candidatus Latescibacterota bacterium]|nr:MAG: N-acetylmuramoyl-L-alanine amidase [Candidatus Latescibacterota bacterium]
MMKYPIFIAVIAFIVAGNAVTQTHAQETITVVYDDGRRADEISAWRLDSESEELFFRANDVARIFKATQFWNASTRKVVRGIHRTRFTITVDTRVVVIDGDPIMLRNDVRYDSGFVMIPMEFLLDIVPPYTLNLLNWDPNTNTLVVEKVGYNVTRLTFATTAERSTATIDLGEPLLHHVDSSTPGLVRLKLYGGRIDTEAFEVSDAHGLFDKVRAEQTDRDAYVYFDIKRYTSRVVVEREESPPKILVILEKGELPEIPEPEYAGKKRVEVVDRRSVERKRLRIETVVLDPGHGGKDHGKTGVTGVLEKDVNLDIAKKTRDVLIQELGVQVVLTREDDRLLSLTKRTELANQIEGDLFISIHCNSWFSDETGGFEAYFLSPARTEWDRAVAMAENAADDFFDTATDAASDIDFILWDIVQNEFINESSHFAELLQKAMNERLSIRNRGVKQANFTVLQGAHMPAVLVETAFLSNPEEEQLLVNEEFQTRVAEGIADAVRKFKERYGR